MMPQCPCTPARARTPSSSVGRRSPARRAGGSFLSPSSVDTGRSPNRCGTSTRAVGGRTVGDAKPVHNVAIEAPEGVLEFLE